MKCIIQIIRIDMIKSSNLRENMLKKILHVKFKKVVVLSKYIKAFSFLLFQLLAMKFLTLSVDILEKELSFNPLHLKYF